MTLIHLIYVSNSRGLLGDAELARVLESSSRHNLLNGVTGMLLYFDGSFMQVLEGGEEAVEETYSRIQQDPRHDSLILIEHGPVEGRSFAYWSMGFRSLNAETLALHPSVAFSFAHGFDVEAMRVKRGIALELLMLFSRTG